VPLCSRVRACVCARVCSSVLHTQQQRITCAPWGCLFFTAACVYQFLHVSVFWFGGRVTRVVATEQLSSQLQL
jgi:hypothetical protein